jgi:hypothetical protein
MASSNIDTEEIIVEVESRPVIWNSALKEYSNKQARRQAWEEIVEKFGAELSKEEKNEIGKKCVIYLLIYYSLLINLFVYSSISVLSRDLSFPHKIVCK